MQSVSFVVMASVLDCDCPIAVFHGRKRDKRRSLSQVEIDQREAIAYAKALSYEQIERAFQKTFGRPCGAFDVFCTWVARFGTGGKFEKRLLARDMARHGFGDGLEAAKILRNYYR